MRNNYAIHLFELRSICHILLICLVSALTGYYIPSLLFGAWVAFVQFVSCVPFVIGLVYRRRHWQMAICANISVVLGIFIRSIIYKSDHGYTIGTTISQIVLPLLACLIFSIAMSFIALLGHAARLAFGRRKDR